MRIHSRPLSLVNQDPLTLHEKQVNALEHSPVMVLIMDKFGVIEYGNALYYTVTNYKEKDVIGKSIFDLLEDAQPDMQLQTLKNAIETQTIWEGEIKNYKKNGQPYYFSGKLMLLENDYNFTDGFILTGQDVSSFKETEVQLESAIKEKNMLLSELHHRVKNNLAIVSGLMQLQAINEDDERVRSKLYKSAGRVSSLAAMHEVLFESESLVKIDLGSMVERIVNAVTELYYDNSQRIEVKFDIDPIKLNINQAHPFSLILNETLSNVYKHAFDAGDSGCITIKVHTNGEAISMIVMDNGKGFPFDFEEMAQRKKKAGYKLMSTLVTQLHGSYKYESDEKGTKFHLQFNRINIFGASNGKLLE